MFNPSLAPSPQCHLHFSWCVCFIFAFLLLCLNLISSLYSTFILGHFSISASGHFLALCSTSMSSLSLWCTFTCLAPPSKSQLHLFVVCFVPFISGPLSV